MMKLPVNSSMNKMPITIVTARLHDALHVWRQLGLGEKKEAGRSGEAETIDLLKRCVVLCISMLALVMSRA
jgi:hypothetical protein